MEILITHKHDAMQIKPRLLHETAEIALTEIKRFLEPRLTETLSLRRVTAPMYLPTDSPLIDRRFPGAVLRPSTPWMEEKNSSPHTPASSTICSWTRRRWW